jgi:hypothetical protein
VTVSLAGSVPAHGGVRSREVWVRAMGESPFFLSPLRPEAKAPFGLMFIAMAGSWLLFIAQLSGSAATVQHLSGSAGRVLGGQRSYNLKPSPDV